MSAIAPAGLTSTKSESSSVEAVVLLVHGFQELFKRGLSNVAKRNLGLLTWSIRMITSVLLYSNMLRGWIETTFRTFSERTDGQIECHHSQNVQRW